MAMTTSARAPAVTILSSAAKYGSPAGVSIERYRFCSSFGFCVNHHGATAVEKEVSILASPPSTHPAVGVKTLSSAAAAHVQPKSTPETAEKLKNHGAAASGLGSPPSTSQEPPPLKTVTTLPSASSPVMTPLFVLHYRR